MSSFYSDTEQISYAARSDVGMRRAMNQDAYEVQVARPDEWSAVGHQFIVADGMGAHAAGELASQLAVEEVSKPTNSGLSPRQALVAALENANAVIHRRGQEDTKLYNMGTTCSTLLIRPEGALIAHVGDSRVYRSRDGVIQQLTFDHSLVWEMRAAGQIAEDISAIPTNVITRCLGPHPEVDVDIEGYFSVQPKDTFLLCSDGLTGRINDHEIGAIMHHLEPQQAVDFLVDLANLRGGADNITTIVIRIQAAELAAAGEVDDTPALARTESHPAWWLVAGLGLVMALGGYEFNQLVVAGCGMVVFVLAAIGAASHRLKRSANANAPQSICSPYATASTDIGYAFTHGICETFDSVLQASGRQPPTDLSDLDAEIEHLRSPGDDADGTTICLGLAKVARTLRGMI